MLKTRGFGHFFLPVLVHLANHNPLKSVPAFIVPDKGKAGVYVTTHNMEAGDPVYTSYGTLSSPVVAAEQYGFVETAEHSAFFEVPSIHEELLTSERNKK